MAEHFEGVETPLRRSRRLGGRAPPDAAGDVYARAVKAAEVGDEEHNGETRNEPTLAVVEAAAEETEKGETARDPTEETLSVSEIFVAPISATRAHSNEAAGRLDDEQKGKEQKTAPSSCKRPLLELKVPRTMSNTPPLKVDRTVPKGKPKSGRVWKDPKERFSVMVKDRPLHTSWDKKMKARQEMRMVKDFARQLRDEKQKAKEEKKLRRADNLKRRLENERKAEIVQVITNPAKLKRAKKKQLRRIEKRDTLALLQNRQGLPKKSANKRKPKSMEKPVPETEQNTN